MPSSSLAVWIARVMPRPANRSSILPIATTGRDAAVIAIEQRLARRRQRVVVAVRGARELPGRADERARDDAADAESLADQPVGDLAGAIELGHRHDVFVRGDLEHAVGRRVDDERAGPQVLGAELVDDRRAGRRLVAEHAAAGQARELVDDRRRRSRAETPGNGRSSTMPIISQWPVTESFPADASAMRPTAAAGAAGGSADRRAPRRDRGRARAASGAAAEPARRCCRACCCPRRRTPSASGNSPMPTLSSTMTMARVKGDKLAGSRRLSAVGPAGDSRLRWWRVIRRDRRTSLD